MTKIKTPKRIEGTLVYEQDEPTKVVDEKGVAYALTQREEVELFGHDAGESVTFEPARYGGRRFARNVLFRA